MSETTKAGDLLDKETFTAGDHNFKITITFVDMVKWNSWFDAHDEFVENYTKLFRQIIFVSHRYLLRVTPIQTGRLRAGWTGILNRYQQDYTQAFMDVSLLHIPADYGKPLDPSAIAQGMTESQYIDGELDVTLINSVPYAEYVEFGTSRMEGQNFTHRAMYKAEYVAANAIDTWIREMTTAQAIVPPPVLEEVVA